MKITVAWSVTKMTYLKMLVVWLERKYSRLDRKIILADRKIVLPDRKMTLPDRMTARQENLFYQTGK